MSEWKTILIIEDDPLLRFSLAGFLEDSGFRCLQAEDGVEGLEIYHRRHPDAVITDLRMPRLDGFAVLSAIRKSCLETPVVVLTGSCDPDTMAEVMATGADVCLQKPLLDMEVLVNAVLSMLDSMEIIG